jgi:EAL domain-containing protein (putative c-di-GMP-specific phosphodiesterase class I)
MPAGGEGGAVRADVLVVDPSSTVRAALRWACDEEAWARQVVDVTTAAEALAAVADHRPDVVVIGSVSALDGRSASSVLREALPDALIIGFVADPGERPAGVDAVHGKADGTQPLLADVRRRLVARAEERGESGDELALHDLRPEQLPRLLELARSHLDMDVAFFSAFDGGRQVYEEIVGDGATFGIVLGQGTPLDDTFCQRVLDGRLPPVIPDVSAMPEPLLPWGGGRGIGAYVGVPLDLDDGRVYGTFCCLSTRPDPALDDRDLRFVTMVGDLIAHEIRSRRRDRDVMRRTRDLIRSCGMAIALQPIRDLATGRHAGFESLARFPTGWRGPAETFAQARAAGVGVELEAHAVDRAIELLPNLRTGQFLAVNLSPRAVVELAPVIAEEHAAVLDRLVVEVTEIAVVERYDVMRSCLEHLRDAGLRLAVDDLGAGFSSLQHLVELRPDIVKLDRSIIHGVADDPVRWRVVRAVTTLASELGWSVVAEGVERPVDLQTVTDLEVDAAQGYAIGRPSTDHDDHRRWAAA